MSKYFQKIDLNETSSVPAKIINLVGKDKRVVEFGCASGYMSKVLKEKCNCEVIGLEINKEDAKIAEAFCKKVITGDIEDLKWHKELEGSNLDVAVFADILEHLKFPEAVLRKTKDILDKDGYILVSVPNIANISIRLELLLGSFEYEKLGILDNTHLKYFTLKSIVNLIETAGFYVDSVDYVVKDLSVSIIKETLKLLDLTPTGKTINSFNKIDATAYQFIVKAFNQKQKQKVVEKVFNEQIPHIYSIDRQIADFKHKRSEREKHIKNLEDDRIEREKHIKNLEKIRAEYVQHVENLEKERAERKRHINNLEKVRFEYAQHVENLEHERVEREKYIHQECENFAVEKKLREKIIKGHEEEISCLQAGLAEKREQSELLKRQLDGKEVILEKLLNSKSWKLTAPLRWLLLNSRKLEQKLKAFCFLSLQYLKIKKSGLFDAEYYLKHNSDVAESGMNPLAHYIKFGAKEGRLAGRSAQSIIEPEYAEKVFYPERGAQIAENDTVSVIIPTLNGGKDFFSLLHSFKRQKGIKKIEMIVVDSGSADNTLALAKDFGAETVTIPSEKFSHSFARNIGAERASGRYLLFVTQDILPSSDFWLYEMLRALKNSDAVAVSCAEFFREDVDLFYRISSWNHHRIMGFDNGDRILSMPESESYLELRKNAQLSDIACLVSNEIFKKYKFRNDYAEDLDFGLRLIKDGYKLAFLNSTKIIHSHNRPPYYYLKRALVDNLTLKKIFPEFQVPFVGTDGFAGDIVFTFDIVSRLVREDLNSLVLPCTTETLIDTVDKRLKSALLSSYTPFKRMYDCNYIDSDFRTFLKNIFTGLQVGKKGYDGILVHAMRGFMQIAGHYIDNSYDLIDEHILEEFNACIYKAYAYQLGAHLAYCYLVTPASKRQKIEKFVNELTIGI